MAGAPVASTHNIDGDSGGGGGGGGDGFVSGDPEKVALVRMKKKKLFRLAMQGKWDEIISMYTNDPSVQALKITRSEDTLLHVAVSDGNTKVVKKLVDAIAENDTGSILLMQNVKGDTPLHLAAAQGMVEVCAAIAKRSPENLVLKARNKCSETPLFLAAKYGKRDAFFALQHAIETILPQATKGDTGRDLPFCRGQHGDTTLHAAISGEYFDVALEIIDLYDPLVNYHNERGETPLHCLANKPYVFKSSSRLGLLDSLIYYCTFVNPLVVKYQSHKGNIQSRSPETKEGNHKLPENYNTCYNAFELLKHLYNTLFSSFRNRSAKKCFIDIDEENPSPGATDQIEQANQEGNDMVNKSHESSSADQRWFPDNYETCIDIFKLALKVLVIVLGIGFWRTQDIARKKRKHIHACQIMDELITRSSSWQYDEDGKKPDITLPKDFEGPSMPEDHSTNQDVEKTTTKDELKGASAILVAAKRGVTEMVEKILTSIPIAVQDLDGDDKNIVLLAVQHRQPHVYRLMLKRSRIVKERVFGAVDKAGNSALHLAATIAEERPWSITGAALQMQWEIKWYKFVSKSMGVDFFTEHNYTGEAASEIFTSKHEQLVKDGGKWLNKTSQSCSVVAALIATVAFASATTVPGGVDQYSGFPTLEDRPGFQIFAISALIALCFSVTSLVMFLSILTSRYQEWDFEYDLPIKLILGLTSLFMSIASMLVSFCAGNFFVVAKNLKYVTYPIYAVMGLPVTFFAIAQFPLYVDLIRATFAPVPERTEKTRKF